MHQQYPQGQPPPYDIVHTMVLKHEVLTLGQNCTLDNICSAQSLPKQTSIGFSGPSDHTYISCPWRAMSQITWMFSPDTTVEPVVLDVNSDPMLSLNGFTLKISNISSEQEGIYYCKVQYNNGSESSAQGAGCAFVAGRAQFRTCPDEPTNKECRGITHLEGEEHGSVEFDARLEYNYGGDCGMKQSVRRMYLNRIDDSGNSESLFICSNLRNLNGRNCMNWSHVSITYQGENKYDLKLSLHSLNMSSSGRYQLEVEVVNAGGRAGTIYKNFNVTVTDKKQAHSPRPNATECTQDFNLPLLMMNGEVLEKDSNLTFGRIMEREHALLCVIPLETTTAEFLYPAESRVPIPESGTPGVYVTRGRQVVRLNHVTESVNVPPEGSYCCSVTTSDGTRKKSCININY